jgi:hypothetical protein
MVNLIRQLHQWKVRHEELIAKQIMKLSKGIVDCQGFQSSLNC